MQGGPRGEARLFSMQGGPRGRRPSAKSTTTNASPSSSLSSSANNTGVVETMVGPWPRTPIKPLLTTATTAHIPNNEASSLSSSFCLMTTPTHSSTLLPSFLPKKMGNAASSSLDLSGIGPPLPLPLSLPSSARASPSRVPKMLLLSTRDNESLVEEILFLRKSLVDLDHQYRLHKAFTAYVEVDNRKLEQDVDTLERKKGQEAPRTGGPSKLKVKLHCVKSRVAELEETCKLQKEELSQLQSDLSVTRVRELEVERDIFAKELMSLNKFIKRLNASHSRMSDENAELGRLRERNLCLEHVVKRFGSSLTVSNENLEKVNSGLAVEQGKAAESAEQLKKSQKKLTELTERTALLEERLGQERTEKNKIEKKIRSLEEEAQKEMRSNEINNVLTRQASEAHNKGSKIVGKDMDKLNRLISTSKNGKINPDYKGKPRKINLQDTHVARDSIFKFLTKLG